jgi:hypothetical protein
MLHLIAILPSWLWHPLGYCTGTRAAVDGCRSYNFWSGVSGSDIAYLITVPLFVLGWYLRHLCHEHRCWRLSWHPDPDHGHPVCKKHHPHDPRDLHGSAHAHADATQEPPTALRAQKERPE